MSDLSDNIFQMAEKYRDEAVTLLRRLIAVPATSNQEGERLKLLKEAVERLGACDRCFFDSFGNFCWVVGQGSRTIFFDGHIDTVGTGPMSDWEARGLDPFEGRYEKGEVWGRGAVDQLSGIVNQVFATKIMRELGLARSYTVYALATVAEETNEGGGPRWIFAEGVRSNLYPRPEVVVLTEPTGDDKDGPLGIYRGHRGRLEIAIETYGRSAHASTPDLGKNAISAMAPIIQDITALQTGGQLVNDPVLGRGSIAISRISDRSPSNNCVAPFCQIIVDRRLTFGESRTTALAEILNMPSIRALGDKVRVNVLSYDEPTWTGYKVQNEASHPSWLTPEDSPAIRAAQSTYKAVLSPRAESTRYKGVFAKNPRLGCWSFSTDGVGVPRDVPVFGFSSGVEQLAHTVEERVDSREMIGAVAFLALFPTMFIMQN